jgi:hypothetical protein
VFFRATVVSNQPYIICKNLYIVPSLKDSCSFLHWFITCRCQNESSKKICCCSIFQKQVHSYKYYIIGRSVTIHIRTVSYLLISNVRYMTCLRAPLIPTHLHVRGSIQKFPDWPPGNRELQIVQLSATRCSCIAILWVSLVNFAAITLCVASQRVIPNVGVYFVIDSVRKL